MRRLVESRTVAWCGLAIVIIVLILTFSLREVWWMFIDIFCAFMTVFCQLVALYSMPKLPAVGKEMQRIAGIFAILFVVSFILEFIFAQIEIP